MQINHSRLRLMALGALFALVLAACGGTGTGAENTSTSSTDTTQTTMGAEAMDDHQEDHDHGVREWSGSNRPTVNLTVEEDSVKGWNVFADVSGFVFAPENASSDHVDGEGHAHIDVDGVRLARVYGPSYNIAGLEPGSHEITFTLAANDHNVYTADGEPIAATVVVDVGEPEETAHAHHDLLEWDGVEEPEVTVRVEKDAKAGWNMFADVAGFEITPRTVGTEHVPGTGHMHLYVNGTRIARLYGTAFHISELPAGDVEVSVRLASNDHMEYGMAGDPIEGSATITVTAEEGTDSDTGMEHADTVHIVVEDGSVVGGLHEITVDVGTMASLQVHSDVTDVVHVHGYDLFFDITPDTAALVIFTAATPGVFEVELESSGLLLALVEVR